MTTATNIKATDELRDSINSLLALHPRIQGMQTAIESVIQALGYVQNADSADPNYNEARDAAIRFSLRQLTEALES